jgi:hypothetical protein
MGAAIPFGRSSSLVLAAVLSIVALAYGQRGGERVFEFIHLPTSARLTALSGSQAALISGDYALAGANPALVNALMNNSLSFQHSFYFDGIGNGYAGFARHIDAWGATVHGGIQYSTYGTFTAADEQGNITGEFTAKDLAISAGIARPLNERMHAGLLVRYIQSSLEAYRSAGIAFDAGFVYRSEDALNHYAIVLKGVGAQFTTYFEGDEKGRMPVDLQLAFSKRFKYVPFRLSILMHDINRWDLRYDSPLDEQEDPIFGDPVDSGSGGFGESVDLFFRHLNFGGEIIIGKQETVMLRVGYSHQRNRELSVVNLRSLAGFSGGLGFNFKSIVIDYGFGVFHQAGSSQHLGLRVNFDAFKPKQLVE